jgi:hypothetical protein
VEHLRASQNSKPEKTVVAENMKDGKKRNYGQKFDVSGLKLVKLVSNHRTLDILESYFIRKQDRQCLMNQDERSSSKTQCVEIPIFLSILLKPPGNFLEESRDRKLY